MFRYKKKNIYGRSRNMNFVDNVDEHENIENEIKNMQNANER